MHVHWEKDRRREKRNEVEEDAWSGGTPITDVVVAVLIGTLLVSSLVSASFILHFHCTRRSHRVRDLNSLWAVRVLLIVFSCLWALAEILRLPHLLHFHLPPSHLCSAYVLTSHGLAEPCFFTTLLFLLEASLNYGSVKDRHPNAFASALTLSLLTSLPFFGLHALLLSPVATWALGQLGVLPETLGRVVGGIGSGGLSAHDMRCSYPLFSTVLLAVFGAVYVPWFVSVCWRAVSVVINKRLRWRLYALAASVVVALSVQVTTFALTAFWKPNDLIFQGLGLLGFVAVLNCALVGHGILVLRPIRDAIEVGTWCAGGGGGGRGGDSDHSCRAPI